MAVFVFPKDLGQFDSYCSQVANLSELERMVSIDFFPGRRLQQSGRFGEATQLLRVEIKIFLITSQKVERGSLYFSGYLFKKGEFKIWLQKNTIDSKLWLFTSLIASTVVAQDNPYQVVYHWVSSREAGLWES